MAQSAQHKYAGPGLGIALLVMANIGFSSKAVIIKLMYRHSVDTISVIALRMLFALPFYVVIAVWLALRPDNVRLTRRQWLAVSGLGILSYYVSSMFDFLGLQYVTASVERLILYTYPTIVLILSAVFLRKKITRAQYIALAVAYAGLLLVFAAEINLGAQRNLWLGAGLIFFCAITYAIYTVLTGEYVHKVGSAKFTTYAVLAATVPALLQVWLYNGFDLFRYPAPVYRFSAWIAIVATVLPTFLLVEGIRMVGANTASLIGLVGPVSVIALGYFFLGEPVTLLQLIGTAVVLAGIGYMAAAEPRA
jgi:drug/metabolite transporter (DMT)-like permease